MIGTLVAKDLKLFFRNRLFAVVTGLALVGYLAVYFLLPDQVRESLGVAYYVENPEVTMVDEALNENDNLTFFETEAEMLSALEDTDEFIVGLSITEAAAGAIIRGEEASLNAYYAPGVPAEVKQIFEDVLVVIANSANPTWLAEFDHVSDTKVVLGPDLIGQPLSMRARFAPLLLLAAILIEVLGIAVLLTQEAEIGTARAMLTGPLRMHQFFLGKLVFGLLLTLGQLLILISVMGLLSVSPLLLLTTLLLGSVLMVGTGFIIAAISKSHTTAMAWGTVFVILFVIPALSVMLPGLATRWMELIPSFYFVDALHRILNFDASWADVYGNLMILAMSGPVALLIGGAAMRKKI